MGNHAREIPRPMPTQPTPFPRHALTPDSPHPDAVPELTLSAALAMRAFVRRTTGEAERIARNLDITDSPATVEVFADLQELANKLDAAIEIARRGSPPA